MKKYPFPDFLGVARDVFSFLEEDYECVFDRAEEKEATNSAHVLFRNRTTFVDIHLERRDSQIILYVGPLRDGEVPAPGLHWYDLGFLLFIRGIPSPTHGGQLNKIRGAAAEKRELEEFAVALRIGAKDVLKGDFAIFSLVEEVIRERGKYKWEPVVARGRLL